MKINKKTMLAYLFILLLFPAFFFGCFDRRQNELLEVKATVQKFIKLKSEKNHESAYSFYSKRWKEEMRQTYHEQFYDETSPLVMDGVGYAKYCSSTEITWSGGKVLSVEKKPDDSFSVRVDILSQIEGTDSPFQAEMKWVREGTQWKYDNMK